MEEKVNNILSKLRRRIEDVEKCAAWNSDVLGEHSKELEHHSHELKRQRKGIESNRNEIECLSRKVKTEHQYEQKENYSEFSKKKGINFLIKKIKCTKIDVTDYSFLPNSLLSMVAHFSITGTDENYIPMFSKTNLFLVDLRLDNKVAFQLYVVETPVCV